MGRPLPSPASPYGMLAYDEDLNRLTDIQLDSTGDVRIGALASLPTAPMPSALTSFGNGYLGWVSDSNARWMIIRRGESGRRLVDGPLLGNGSVPYSQRVLASANLKVCVKPDQTKFAVLYGSAGRIELHDSSAALLDLAATPDSSNGDFELKDGVARWNRHRYYYSDCAATDQYLFALFSGQVEGVGVEMAYAGDRVQVFDWSGALRGVLALPFRVARMAVDAEQRSLYGSGTDGETIYRFSIPAEFQGVGR